MGKIVNSTFVSIDGVWPRRAGRYADRINAMRKVVVSSGMTEAGWANTQVLGNDVVETVATLRSEPGDIRTSGVIILRVRGT